MHLCLATLGDVKGAVKFAQKGRAKDDLLSVTCSASVVKENISYDQQLNASKWNRPSVGGTWRDRKILCNQWFDNFQNLSEFYYFKINFLKLSMKRQ